MAHPACITEKNNVIATVNAQLAANGKSIDTDSIYVEDIGGGVYKLSHVSGELGHFTACCEDKAKADCLSAMLLNEK